MLKPKYVHGINANDSPKSLLNRLQNQGCQILGPNDLPPSDDPDHDTYVPVWSWTLA